MLWWVWAWVPSWRLAHHRVELVLSNGACTYSISPSYLSRFASGLSRSVAACTSVWSIYALGLAAAVGLITTKAMIFLWCVTLAAGLFAGRLLRGKTSVEMEAVVANATGISKGTTIGGVVARSLLNEDQVTRGKAIRKWTRRARLQFGMLKDTTADRIVLRRWLAEQMKAEDMRDKDACRLIPFVVATFFLPTAEELEAAQWVGTDVAEMLRGAVQSPTW